MRKFALIAIGLAVAISLCVFAPQEVLAGDPRNADVCVGDDDCNKFINTYVNPMIVLLSALVGIVAIISIIVAGIQYASSADDPGTVSKAKQRIFNTVIGLVAYVFLYAFVDYLVPGGLIFR